MTRRRKIGVIGATGNVGGHLVAQLAATSADVRAIVRDPGRAAFPPVVEVARGDLSDPARLQEPLRGVDALFLVWPFLSSAGAREVLEVAKQHVRRVVYLSASGVNLRAENQAGPILAFHADLERAIEETGLEWVFLRPSSFASNNLGWTEQIRTGLVRAAGAFEVRAPIHEADIAAVALRALTEDKLVGTRPEITGPQALTTAEQALAIGEALNIPVRFEEMSREEARAEAIAAEYPTDLVAALFDHAGEFAPQRVTSSVEEITGQPPRSIREWALDNAEKFHS